MRNTCIPTRQNQPDKLVRRSSQNNAQELREDARSKQQLITQRLDEVRAQLERIDEKMDQQEEVLKNGKNKEIAKQNLQYLFQQKHIYEQYYDKLVKDQIAMDVLVSDLIPKQMEALNKELETINDESARIFKQVETPEPENNKYTSEVVEELLSRNYKCDIPEEELDRLLLPFQEQVIQDMIQNKNKNIIPPYYQHIVVKQRRSTLN